MSPHLIATSALFAPLSRFWRSLQPRVAAAPVPMHAPLRWQPAGASHTRPSAPIRSRPVATASARRQRQPLRVVRVMESGQASAMTGRILMSGRMADVCAELERMVERESATSPVT